MVVAEVRAGRGAFVTCFWKAPLELLHQALVAELGAEAVAYVHGGIPAKKRAQVTEGVVAGRIRVVLMTAGCAVGITLVNLKSVFVLGVALDLAKENQAIGRVAGRVGQDNTVTITLVTPTVYRGQPTVVQFIRACHTARAGREEGLLRAKTSEPGSVKALGLGNKTALLFQVAEDLAKHWRDGMMV
jgi:superfamily II DNA/RNA helicase